MKDGNADSVRDFGGSVGGRWRGREADEGGMRLRHADVGALLKDRSAPGETETETVSTVLRLR